MAVQNNSNNNNNTVVNNNNANVNVSNKQQVTGAANATISTPPRIIPKISITPIKSPSLLTSPKTAEEKRRHYIMISIRNMNHNARDELIDAIYKRSQNLKQDYKTNVFDSFVMEQATK